MTNGPEWKFHHTLACYMLIHLVSTGVLLMNSKNLYCLMLKVNITYNVFGYKLSPNTAECTGKDKKPTKDS